MKYSIITTASDEEFKNVVMSCNSICDVLEHYGFSRASGSMSKIVKNRIIKDNIDISHFNRGGNNEGHPIYSMDEILVQNSKYENTSLLKNRILKENLLEYKCTKCGNTGEWNGEKLVLQLEHINGIHNDHRIENLCFLCPNCHSQTKTYSGRNRNAYNNTEWHDYKN